MSVGFLQKEYWSGLPFPSPGDLAHPGIEFYSLLHWKADSLSLTREAQFINLFNIYVAVLGLSCVMQDLLRRTDSWRVGSAATAGGFYLLCAQHAARWILVSSPGNRTRVPCSARQIFNHRTTREVSTHLFNHTEKTCTPG